jgi:hypothetical protein
MKYLLAPLLLLSLALPAQASNESAKSEFTSQAWVRDTYISPGHMNLGVYPEEKVWSSNTFRIYVCGVLNRNKSDLRFVRFVDMRAIMSGKSPRQAEVHKVQC